MAALQGDIAALRARIDALETKMSAAPVEKHTPAHTAIAKFIETYNLLVADVVLARRTHAQANARLSQLCTSLSDCRDNMTYFAVEATLRGIEDERRVVSSAQARVEHCQQRCDTAVAAILATADTNFEDTSTRK